MFLDYGKKKCLNCGRPMTLETRYSKLKVHSWQVWVCINSFCGNREPVKHYDTVTGSKREGR